ncbi:MAG: glycosyltransferase [Pirellulales bacterium]
MPFISIILPVPNGVQSLERAVRSVQAQTVADWELLAVDDASTDGTAELLERLAAEDARLRIFATTENVGECAARNVALREARGQWIAYLDQDDEFAPDYLALVTKWAGKGEVLVFGYYVVDDAAPREWWPEQVGQGLFAHNIVAPLGVAHRRELVDRVGGFNEMLWREGDWEYWRRLARVGASFVFVPFKSGRYHTRPDSASRVVRLTPRQREAVEANWAAGRGIFESPPGARAETGAEYRCLFSGSGPTEEDRLKEHLTAEREEYGAGETPAPQDRLKPGLQQSAEATPNVDRTRRVRRKEEDGTRRVPATIAFASTHSVIDFTSGAAIATGRALELLDGLGFSCQAFCGSRLDAPEEMLFEELLAARGAKYESRKTMIGEYPGRMTFTFQGRVPVTVFQTASTRGRWSDQDEAEAFFTAFARFLDKFRPDVLLTYGGDPVCRRMVQIAKGRDIPIVFALHNFLYPDAEAFRTADYVIVPSEFSRRHHWEKLGLACHRLPNVIDPGQVRVAKPRPEFVTFVNPQGAKGLFVFARIARELLRRRPDIPVLVVEGRGQARNLEQTGLEPGEIAKLRRMENKPDPRDFLAVTRVLLVPSLWNESFGLVAAEAMANGIPVLASNRGSLPEIVGQGGLLFDIPARYTPQTREAPTAEEMRPWVETIGRLWDDADLYRRASRAAADRALVWSPERLAPAYRDFFQNVRPQPAAPVVPKESQAG